MQRAPTDRADVCIVGAGPAGAIVANRLASDGYDVTVLEAGRRFDFTRRRDQMEQAIRPGERGDVWEMGGERDDYSDNGARTYPLNVARVKGVGGSTLHWQGMVMRMHPADFDAGHDNDDPAWPISYDDLRPYYDEAERALGVAGDADNPFAPPRDEPTYPMPGFEPSYSDSIFAEACEKLGIAMHSVPNARNSESYDGRGQCVGYGTCQPVCPSGAKYDATVHIEDAEAAGATVIDRVPVQRLETDGFGRVSAAVYVTPEGEEYRQAAREFVLAAGGVEIPRLLLLSANDDHPHGLANSSGAVGRYFMDHLFAGSGGTLDRETRQNHIGFITSESHQFYDDPGGAVEHVDTGETFVAESDDDYSPIKLEFLNYAGPSPVEIALTGEDWGDAMLDELRGAYGNSIAMGGLVGQPPRWENRVRLNTDITDDHGNPVPDIMWSWGDRVRRSISRANAIQHAVLDELGVDIAWTANVESGSGPAYHHMGTTRMGADPEESVVNPQLRSHDLRNLSIASSSVFVTAGSMNPTLTIAALALKCADHLEERL
ncbi:GMC family oxidoreductase [Haloarcula onubensis]|uniref:GMC family oxidoreductase n=1 Tax=Haloarcula onubensis TaxID=2950539 RepID=A0ABU2FR73_9EURY|nr:GMC family oxidoreductase [Halomicroarcula sp. S3CR25-11]MDS0283270.1 GMC family oxidoreductase [Halomicroarcula sp. S3CR25-11]